MSAIAKFVQRLATRNSRDLGFEQYYGAIVMSERDGVPSAAEARRDFEPVRRVMERAIIF